MIARLSPLVTASCMSALCGAAILTRHRGASVPPAPLTGVLFKASSMTATSDGESLPPLQPAAYLPEIRLGADAAARAKLPPGTEFIARFVPPGASTFTVTLAYRPSAAPRHRPKPPQQLVAAAPDVKPAEPPPTPPAPPEPPKPVQPVSFVEYDEALRASATTQAINTRLKRAGVTFRLTHVGVVGSRGAVRFAVANEEPADFFLSIVNVFADGAPVPSETAGPYSCRSGEEIFGIVHFKPATVAGKKVTIELIQSGGERRRFDVPLEYRFRGGLS